MADQESPYGQSVFIAVIPMYQNVSCSFMSNFDERTKAAINNIYSFVPSSNLLPPKSILSGQVSPVSYQLVTATHVQIQTTFIPILLLIICFLLLLPTPPLILPCPVTTSYQKKTPPTSLLFTVSQFAKCPIYLLILA